MKRKASSSSRRSAFPTLLGIIGLLLWCVSPLDAQPISDAEHRANFEEMIRLIDAGEVLFAEDGGDLAVFYPDEIGTDRLARARIATQVVRDRLQDELDALEAADGSRNPTSLIPESRPHREPPPVDWEVEGVSVAERCDALRTRISELETEEARLESGIDAARRRMEPLDEDGWAEFQALATILRGTALLHDAEVADKVAPYFERESIGALEEVLWDASNACEADTIGIVKPDWEWACGTIPTPRALGTSGINASTTLKERVEARARIRKETGLPRMERELADVKARLRDDARAFGSLDCPDDEAVDAEPMLADLYHSKYRVEWIGTSIETEPYKEYYSPSHLSFLSVECSTESSCDVTGFLDAPFAGRCSLTGEVSGRAITLRPAKELYSCSGGGEGRRWRLEGTLSGDLRTMSGQAVFHTGRGTERSGSWTAEKLR